MHSVLTELAGLAYFMLPAWLANMAPPFARFWRGWNRPIHRELLGDHKTVVGFVLALAIGFLAVAAQALVQPSAFWRSPDYWPWLGLAFGLGTAGGDALKSLVKRRLHRPPGAPWIPFDQLDFVAGSLLLAAPFVRLSPWNVIAILAMTFAGDLLVNRLSFHLGIKRSPW
ncbi:CDP-archaeol synthase [Lysobacter arvi]|uniref:CDP-archaeol synthase n=1 Tax=Lysobacter arvi TaxID=3038776 RepID=A0ABU1C9V9_9GAMM|nr:CDP-archaeol synthase [Lysobacter arvi]MDR0181977.1 CDP-archaeol synthase [Lysobacter arvi]